MNTSDYYIQASKDVEERAKKYRANQLAEMEQDFKNIFPDFEIIDQETCRVAGYTFYLGYSCGRYQRYLKDSPGYFFNKWIMNAADMGEWIIEKQAKEKEKALRKELKRWWQFWI